MTAAAAAVRTIRIAPTLVLTPSSGRTIGASERSEYKRGQSAWRRLRAGAGGRQVIAALSVPDQPVPPASAGGRQVIAAPSVPDQPVPPASAGGRHLFLVPGGEDARPVGGRGNRELEMRGQ